MRGKPNADVRARESEISDFKSPPCDFPKTENLKRKTSGEAETIGTTSNHPFWSEDRQEFVQAGSLEIGERLQTLSGDVKVVQQKLPRPGPQPVFNLEVHDEHVYFVGEDGVLVHNSREYSLGNVSTGDGRVHITYRGTKGGDSYTGYASLPEGAVKGLSKVEAQQLVLNSRYANDFSDFDSMPMVVHYGGGKLGKQTSRGLEHHYYLADRASGVSVANAQRPVGLGNAPRAKYENALQ